MTLALGDIKALLMHIISKHTAEEIFAGAGLLALIEGNTMDHSTFNPHRNRIWAELRKHFPEKMDPSKLEGETLKADECPATFLHAFQRKWREETGNAWNANNTTESLFKVMVKKALPLDIQKHLEGVVGLMKMGWPLFSEHIIHHVEGVREDKKREEDANQLMASKLTKLQLSELNSKQKKDKGKVQAPVVTVFLSYPLHSSSIYRCRCLHPIRLTDHLLLNQQIYAGPQQMHPASAVRVHMGRMGLSTIRILEEP